MRIRERTAPFPLAAAWRKRHVVGTYGMCTSNIQRSFCRSGSILLAAALPLVALHAGDDGAVLRVTVPSPSAQMDAYLQAQKITHSVVVTGGDFKGDGAETLTVKVYDVSADARQDAICTALAATAKKARVRGPTVLFFTLSQASTSQPVSFQPSRLPSGNAEVEFASDPTPPSYRLRRTVKL